MPARRPRIGQALGEEDVDHSHEEMGVGAGPGEPCPDGRQRFEDLRERTHLPEMEIVYTLRLPRDSATVPLVRTLCRDAMTRLGVASSCRADVALALTEACANVVQHAEGVTQYEVLVELAPQTCHIRVVDTGQGLDTRDELGEMPDAEDDRGRGIALMRLLVDRIAFDSRPEDGTVVHLEKSLELEEGSLLKALG